MTTLANLADEAQNALADSSAATWTQAQVEQWCNAAIREYSKYFPRTIETSINCADDDHTYDLPAGFQQALSVEYPAGEDPPQFLTWRGYRTAGFFGASGFYDVIRNDDNANVNELWISEAPATGETITVIHTADHPHDLAAGGTVTVPSYHHNLLISWVVWQAYRERLSAEVASSYPNLEHMNSLAAAVAAAAAEWREQLAAATTTLTQPDPYTGPWAMDPYDRIY